MNQIKIQQKVQLKDPLIPHGSIAITSWDAKRNGCVFLRDITKYYPRDNPYTLVIPIFLPWKSLWGQNPQQGIFQKH